jgi:hypothetical protein
MDTIGLGGFAFYQRRIPGCFTFIGVSQADWETSTASTTKSSRWTKRRR